MDDFAGIFEVLASDQHDARVASRKALVLSRDRLDARLGKFLAASRSPEEFTARYDLVSDDFAGIVRVAANEVGHGDPDALVETLRAHYADKEHWIQDAVKKPGDLHKKLHVPEDEKIPEEKIENAEKSGDKNLKEKAQFAENVKKGSTISDYLSSYYSSDDEDDEKKKTMEEGGWGVNLDDEPVEDEDDKKKSSIQKKGKKCAECKDKNHSDCSGGNCSCKKCGSDDGDDSLEFAAKTAGENVCPRCGGSGETGVEGDGDECPKCHGTGKEHDDERESSARTSDEKGNTGLSGPSPKMDKERWTPKSVKPIDVPSERHPTVQKDVMEVMPKNNLTGPAHDMDEINALTIVETLPSEKDNSGFQGGGQDFGPHTKTFGDGGQVDPVKSESLKA